MSCFLELRVAAAPPGRCGNGSPAHLYEHGTHVCLESDPQIFHRHCGTNVCISHFYDNFQLSYQLPIVCRYNHHKISFVSVNFSLLAVIHILISSIHLFSLRMASAILAASPGLKRTGVCIIVCHQHIHDIVYHVFL